VAPKKKDDRGKGRGSGDSGSDGGNSGKAEKDDD
jgi:hypothetical protein